MPTCRQNIGGKHAINCGLVVHSDGVLLTVKRSTSNGLTGSHPVRHCGLLEALWPHQGECKKLATLEIKTFKSGELRTPPGHRSAEWASSVGTATSQAANQGGTDLFSRSAHTTGPPARMSRKRASRWLSSCCRRSARWRRLPEFFDLPPKSPSPVPPAAASADSLRPKMLAACCRGWTCCSAVTLEASATKALALAATVGGKLMLTSADDGAGPCAKPLLGAGVSAARADVLESMDTWAVPEARTPRQVGPLQRHKQMRLSAVEGGRSMIYGKLLRSGGSILQHVA